MNYLKSYQAAGTTLQNSKKGANSVRSEEQRELEKSIQVKEPTATHSIRQTKRSTKETRHRKGSPKPSTSFLQEAMAAWQQYQNQRQGITEEKVHRWLKSWGDNESNVSQPSTTD